MRPGPILLIFFMVAPVFSQGAILCSEVFSQPNEINGSSDSLAGNLRVEGFSKSKKSKTIRLFNRGQPVKDYHKLIETLKPDDKIDFDNGHVFNFYGFLSDPRRGDLTTIIDIGDGKALRVSRHYYNTSSRSPETMAKEMTDWFVLMDELNKNGVPVVKVYRDESQPPMFIVVKKESFLFRLSDLFVKGELNFKNPALQNVTPEVIKEALDKLVDFTRKTWMYRSIGDFRYEQLGYNGQNWILFDVGARDHRPLANFDEKFHIFSVSSSDPYSGSDIGNFLPKKIRKEMGKVIKEHRNRAQEKGPWITRKSDPFPIGDSNYLLNSVSREPLESGRVFNIKSGDPKTSRGNQIFLDFWVEDRMSLSVTSFIKRNKNYSFYQVRLPDDSVATLKILLWNSEKNLAHVRKQVEELKQNHDPVLVAYGTDFIVLNR